MIATPAAFKAGGRDPQGFGNVLANSVVRKNKIFGVMKLTLSPTSYSWDYVADPITPVLGLRQRQLHLNSNERGHARREGSSVQLCLWKR